MNKRWFRTLFRRRVLIILLLVLQIAFLVYIVSSTSQISRNISRALTLLSGLVVLSIIAKKDNSTG